MKNFRNLGLSEETLNVLEKQGILEPTEIQSRAIPFALEGQDIIASSSTGSGKTLAFASALTEKIQPNGKIQAIVLAPTRELAEQVTDAIRLFANKRLKLVSVYGGVPIENQMNKIKRSDIVVGTPGRVLDHLERKTLNLKDVKVLVLDEFDRMLDMGFHKDVDKIIKQAPKERQTLLFSATTKGVEHLLDKYTKNAIEITTKSYVDHSKLKQIYYDTQANMKFSLLVHLLEEEKKQNSGLVIIFCSTKRNVDFVARNLNQNNINAKAIHGGLEQKKRIRVLKEFHENNFGVLVCTDVASRGLDIKGVSHVYNYDLPKTPEDYIHRIGRTARAGENGVAINILSSRDYDVFSDILNKKKMDIKEVKTPYVNRIFIDKEAEQRSEKRNSQSRRNDPSRGRRPSRDRDSSRDRSPRSRDSSPRSRDRGDVKMHDAVCKKCGKKCQVPFKPTTGVGVSCSECFVRRDSNKRGSPGRKSDRRGNERRGNDTRSNDRRSGDRRGNNSRGNDRRDGQRRNFKSEDKSRPTKRRGDSHSNNSNRKRRY